MKNESEINENWGKCPQCGQPVLIDPKSGKAEACSNCASLRSQTAGMWGVASLIAGVAAVVVLVYFCIAIMYY